MTDKLNRLTNDPGKFTIADIIKISKQYYKSSGGNDKKERSKLDVVSCKITSRKNYTYDPSLKQWVQSGRDVLLTFLVTTEPISYKKSDTIKKHKYPIFVLIHDIEKGIYSNFRWRTGSLKKPIFKKVGMTSEQVANANIRNMVQMQFVTDLMWALKLHGLLYGKCWVNRPAKICNSKNIPFADKHFWFVLEKLLVKMIQMDGGIVRQHLIKNNKI